MSTVVFLGPSLPRATASQLLPDAMILEPAACGDVYRVSRQSARVIVLIDGYFDQRLAVWHKELLWALAQGVVVYGAASMGALRAVELEPFGMRGVGKIYEQFRSGELEDDDEVAVAHQSAAHDFKSTSDAMVNIRATLRAARQQDVIDGTEEARLVDAAKRTFYPQRSFRSLLRSNTSRQNGAARDLERWFAANGLIDQKRSDAALLLSTLAKVDNRGSSSAAARFHFEHTHFFEVFRRNIEEARQPRR